MSSEPEFLKAIFDNPDDDTLRIAFAKWLNAQGQTDRATFIRRQCKHALDVTKRYYVNHPSWQQAERLEDKHRDDWLKNVPKCPAGVTWGFVRGLPGFLAVKRWSQLAPHLDKLFLAAPIESLRFNRLGVSGARVLAKSPHLARIRSLDLSDRGLTDLPTLQVLLAAPGCSGLRKLFLNICKLGDAGAKVVANCPHLAGLLALDLTRNDVGDDGGMAIARSPHLDNLQMLWFRANRISSRTTAALKKRFGMRIQLVR